MRKNFFCSSQSAESPLLRDFRVMCSGNVSMSARWMISGESCANWSVWDTTARSLPRCLASSCTLLNRPLIKVLLPLNTVGNSFQQRNLILHALHNSTLVNVSVFGALPLITIVTISEARLTSDSIRATWERSDLRCSASSNTVEKVSQILLYLPHNFSNLLRQFFFIISRIMTDRIDPDIFEFFSQFLFNFCCFKQTFRCLAHNYNNQWQL